jgi:predicted DNA-binding ribbon-helix-helix protein
MHTLQISDELAAQLDQLAAEQQISVDELMAQLIQARAQEQSRKSDLKAFFGRYQKDLSAFRFDRDQANERVSNPFL